MSEYVYNYRRHNKVTFRFLFIWYAGSAIFGTLIFVLYCAIYKLATGTIAQNIDIFFVLFVPVYSVALIFVWKQFFAPAVKAEQEHALAELEEAAFKSYGQ